MHPRTSRLVVATSLLLGACGAPEAHRTQDGARTPATAIAADAEVEEALDGGPAGPPPARPPVGEPHGGRDSRAVTKDARERVVYKRADGGTPAGAEATGRHMAPGAVSGLAAGGGAGSVLLQDAPSQTESYAAVDENGFRSVAASPLSTFSIDVDTASYSVVRRHLRDGVLPPPGAVRLEEMVNYFPYGYTEPGGEDPFSVAVDGAVCPWEPRHRLVRIGLKGRTFDEASRPAANLVFLIDVSGSMQPANKLPLLVQSLRLLAERLQERDRVSLVVYAGSSGLVLPATPGSDRSTIIDALERLSAGGSTNGGSGIRLAYATAKENRIEGGINRVLLCTDGDFNVGTSSTDELVELVKAGAGDGVFLTVLGFGTGNLKDDRLEALADRGNGNYAYIDDLAEGRKVLVEQAGGTLHAIAKDVKIQVEFNPERVAGYRLLGYENRMLAAEDFRNDAKDAGEIGAGHTVTALYEIVPAGIPVPGADVDALKYRREGATTGSGEMLTVHLRFKDPDGAASRPLDVPYVDAARSWSEAGDDFRFAAAVACFAMTLRGSEHRGTASYDTVRELASDAMGDDPQGLRREFLALVEKAAALNVRGTR